MQAVYQQPVAATVSAPPGLTALGARIEAPFTRAVVSAYMPAGYSDATGLWSVLLDAPLAIGDYVLVWRTPDAEPPSWEAFEPLSIVAAPAPPADPITFKPDVQDVAYVTPAYTRGGFDDDGEQAGAEQGTFTDATSPTAAHVAALIEQAADEVVGRVGVAITARLAPLAKRTIVWNVAASIAAGKQPAGTDDASGEYRNAFNNYINCLNELVTQAREGGMRLV